MTKPQTFRLILTGPYAGKDAHLNGYDFEDGVLELYGTMEAVQGVVTYMGRAYQAYLEGSDELKFAQNRDMENANGEYNFEGQTQPQEGEDHSPGDIQPEGSGSDSVSAIDGVGSGEDEEGAEGGVSDRDGHEDSGVSTTAAGQSGSFAAEKNLELKKAVLSLDVDNDEHWTKAGIPALAAVEVAYGYNGITRKDIQKAAPEWDRDRAREAERAKIESELGEIVG
jgi:hypothetical protein